MSTGHAHLPPLCGGGPLLTLSASPSVASPGGQVYGFPMRSFEIIAALVVAAALFIGLKLLGLMVKFAAIAALLGFGAGLWLAYAFRRKQ